MMQLLKFWPTLIGLLICSYGQSQVFSYGLGASISGFNKFRYTFYANATYAPYLSVWGDADFRLAIDAKAGLFNNHLGTAVNQDYLSPLSGLIAISAGPYVNWNIDNEGRYYKTPIHLGVFESSLISKHKNNLGALWSWVFQSNFNSNSQKKLSFNQRLGYVSANFSNFYLSYYNDGGPVLSFFGDRKDRYWTGGLMIGYDFDYTAQTDNGKVSSANQSVQILFGEYTGDQQCEYQVGGYLLEDFVKIKDYKQLSHNTSVWMLRYFNREHFMGASLNLWDRHFDLQDWLHQYVSLDPYHLKLNKPSFDISAYGSYSQQVD